MTASNQHALPLPASNTSVSSSLAITASHRKLHAYFYDVLTLINENAPQAQVLAKIADGICQFEQVRGASVFQHELDKKRMHLLIDVRATCGEVARRDIILPTDWLCPNPTLCDNAHDLSADPAQLQPWVIALPEVYRQKATDVAEVFDHNAIAQFCKADELALVMPFFADHRMCGVLIVFFQPTYTLGDEASALIKTFAKQIEMVMNNAGLREQALQNAVKLERNRLGRDLHDSVSQALYTANLMAETLPTVWEQDASKGLQQLNDIQRMVKLALAEMRSLLVELRPVVLVESSLNDLLSQLANVVSYRSKIPVEVVAHERSRLPNEVQVSFYRIAQEALNNVMKYSGASEVKIELSVHAVGGLLRIRDNGRGFDPTIVTGTHMGLRIMRERASEVGADLKIQSQIGTGTTIQVIWDRYGNQDDD
ncbi:MAG: sensor histidine kinase [Anaerolineae bacterium]|nr:sensor histidine kinase [Anaerolineae bacterium]